ncbi:hypothetical protein Cgig2_006005 [Carnegiea gigantea]|uniref:Amidase domain-containing protein n=1 Tax=Carnegiea gigantea TaxID=171969 RepID=A0A9Q1L025_9CARY|nr:hypothetical protein Cgig2_006005 [Carnegiea gigantea]
MFVLRVHVNWYCCIHQDSAKYGSQFCTQQAEIANGSFSIQEAFQMLDAAFFAHEKMVNIVREALEFNVPIIEANRKLVAASDGGLQYPPVLVFHADWGVEQAEPATKSFGYPSHPDVQRPDSEEDIAFMSILELGQLIKSKQISSVELTQIFLRRLKRYDPILQAVVTVTEELAYEQAKEADQLLSQGVYVGPLHGIPYALKDIISVPHYKTTWGSGSFKDQVLDIEAWVYKRLKSAGAVLVAKLVTGSLAYDDIWFGGRTRNPWNIEEYAAGSSAGPAAGTSAGMVPFAIGSETCGSITYPASRCGVTALRPTFGTVGRTGVMSISESLDKLGPFCRTAEDCAIILDIIRGKDPDDLSSFDMPLGDPFSVDLTKLTVGYLEDAEKEVVDVLASKGVNIVPFQLNYTIEDAQGILNFTMDVDMLAHFDDWQRAGLDDAYEAQDQWPFELRRARVIPAVDYVQAQRARGRLIREVRKSFTVDAFIGNATDWEKVCMGNLVGMPVMIVPVGFAPLENPPSNDSRRRRTITTGIYAPPQHDHIALALAMAYQSATDHHKQRPPIDDLGPRDSLVDTSSDAYPSRQPSASQPSNHGKLPMLSMSIKIVTNEKQTTRDTVNSKNFNSEACSKRAKYASGSFSLQEAFQMLDAGFFTHEKMADIVKEASEFNVPIFEANRKLVAKSNGGLKYPSALVFHSDWAAKQGESVKKSFVYPSYPDVQRPDNEEDIAFMSVRFLYLFVLICVIALVYVTHQYILTYPIFGYAYDQILELGQLIKSKQISSVELTEIFLRRLKRYNPTLQAVVTVTEELAYKQAKEADKLLSQGVYLGPLHGIPYGLKDIIAVPDYKTTWGSGSFKEQVVDMEAWVYKRLKSAGGVPVAKLVSGSLAYDDIWFGGRTRNPWNIEEYSTGSSAGPAACTSAGMVPFAIASETAGSMTYPAAHCGVTALRPTFGTVGRTGVMSISESLDKLGPFCRTAEDCAIILDIIRGKDPDDLSSSDMPFGDPFSVDISKLTVGYLEDAEKEVVDILVSKGVNMVPFQLNYTVDSAQGILNFTMDVDMLAHFDEWQRAGLDDAFEAQDQWPLELRRARVIPAVDYLQAQRARGRLIQEVRESFTVDAFIGNATDWEKVSVGNLVGMPVMVVPVGFSSIENPPSNDIRRRRTVTTGIYAPPQHDHIALALAMAYQSATNHHKQRPPIDDLGPDDKISHAPSDTYPPRQLRVVKDTHKEMIAYGIIIPTAATRRTCRHSWAQYQETHTIV